MKSLYFLLFSLISVSMFSQGSYTLESKVFDKQKNPLDLALIELTNQGDSTDIRYEYSDSDGSFVFSGLEKGEYSLVIDYLGFENYRDLVSLENSITIPEIYLSRNVNMLEELTVSAKIPFIERKIDRTVITPEAAIGNAGSNALEVLDRAPGLIVDSDGGITLKGRSGVGVFINGKPSYLSGTELRSYLESLPSGSIKHMEIMENPPSNYEAAGNAGVINIVIKRSTLKGLFGNTSLSYRRSRYNGSNNSLNLNYNTPKLSLYSNLSGGFYQSFQDLNINRYFKNESNDILSSFAQNSFNERQGKYFNGKIGLDYYLNTSLTLGLSIKKAWQPLERNVDNTSNVSDADNSLIQSVVADNLDERSFDNSLYNVYISKTLDTLGSKLSVDADYVSYDSRSNQNFKNFSYDPNGVLTYQDQINGEIPSDIRIYTAKSDYSKVFTNGSRFEGGLKTAFTETDNEAIYSNTINNITTPDYNLSNRFLYDEWIHAAYVTHSTKLGKANIKAGLRAESTHLNGNQLGNIEKPDSSFTRSYQSLFPTFYASFNLDSNGHHSLNFSYGRRINRPYFQDLNPFISPLNQFTFYGGNPNLLPTYAHNLSLSHSFKGKLNTSLNYSRTNNGIFETLEIVDGIYYSRPGNIATDHALTLSINASLQPYKWYSLNAYAEVGHLSYESPLYTQQLKSSGTYYFISANNGFNLGNEWKAEISGRYITDVTAAQLVIKSYGLVNLGLQKSIWDSKATIRIAANDILYSRRGSGIINNLESTDADWDSKYDSRNIVCTFSTRFGSATSQKPKHNSNSSESEQSRVKG